MGDRTFSRLVDQVTGDGWLLSASAEVGQVSYAIEMREVWAYHNGARLSGSEVTVRLSNHSIDPHYWKDQPLTLVPVGRLSDQRLHQRRRHAVRADRSAARVSAFADVSARPPVRCPTSVLSAALGFSDAAHGRHRSRWAAPSGSRFSLKRSFPPESAYPSSAEQSKTAAAITTITL